MIEVLTFFNSVASNKWIPALWGRLKHIRKEREKELDQINTIMFGDPVELAKYYVEPDCQEMNPTDRRVDDEMVSKQPVMVKINQFFKQPSFHHGSNQLFILSDAGMGKSALLVMLKLMYLTRFWPGDHNCVLKKLGCSSLDEVNAVENKRKTILLLDSLDEDPMAYGRVNERLMDVLEASQHFYKVIITCRTQFFPETERHELELPGQVCIGAYRCYSKYLSFFNNQKVYQYLSKRFPKRFFGTGVDQKKIDDAQKIIDRMGSMRCRPMLLSYIEDLMASLSVQKGDNEYRVFDVLIDSWLRRELTKKRDIKIEDLYDACIILAVWMQSQKKREISEPELDQLIEKISKKVKTVTQIDLKGRSLLNRNSEGDYRFSHYSIQEFCVAKYICEKPLFKLMTKIPINKQTFKMIIESGRIDSDIDVQSLDLSALIPSEALEKRILMDSMEFVYIPCGIYNMGSSENELERLDSEILHVVLITHGFYMQTAPVTQKQWKDVMGENPSGFKGNSDRPVENVSWNDVQNFIKKLNKKNRGALLTLPSEAQWEYACRAGASTRYYNSDSEQDLDRVGWYIGNSDKKTHPVGQKEPNAYGLYDMHGNVLEWVEDDWHADYKGAPLDGSAWIDEPKRGACRVIRGGCWYSCARDCRSACRIRRVPGFRNGDLGFRLVLLPGQPE